MPNLSDYSSSGNKAIDALLGGGFIRGKAYLIEADNGTQPQQLTCPFVKDALDHNELVVFASNERPAEEVKEQLREYRINVEEKTKATRLVILDLWSEEEEETKPGVIYSGNPEDPQKALFAYQQAYQLATTRTPRLPVRLVRDSLSGSVMNFGFERAYRLASRVIRFTKLGSFVSLAIIVPRMHPPIVAESFEHLYDGVIRLTLQEERDRLVRYIRVFKSPVSDFNSRQVPYELASNGFALSMDFT